MAPELAALIAAAPPAPRRPRPWPDAGEARDAWLAEVDALRAEIEAAAPLPLASGPEVAAVDDVRVGVDDGQITARVYRPAGDGPFPAVLQFHGGGFWLGGGGHGLRAADAGCRLLCAATGAVVANVDYRLAPRHRFPVPLADCFAALRWVHAHASELGVDRSRVAVGGASAGANLAAGVARRARDEGVALCFQQLLVPATDATMSSASITENGHGFDMTTEILGDAWDLYLGPDADRRDPWVSPLFADDLGGVAPTQVVVGEHDLLRDEGLAYAERLRRAGVPTELVRLAMTHGIATPAVGARYLEVVVSGFTAAFARS